MQFSNVSVDWDRKFIRYFIRDTFLADCTVYITLLQQNKLFYSIDFRPLFAFRDFIAIVVAPYPLCICSRNYGGLQQILIQIQPTVPILSANGILSYHHIAINWTSITLNSQLIVPFTVTLSYRTFPKKEDPEMLVISVKLFPLQDNNDDILFDKLFYTRLSV